MRKKLKYNHDLFIKKKFNLENLDHFNSQLNWFMRGQEWSIGKTKMNRYFVKYIPKVGWLERVLVVVVVSVAQVSWELVWLSAVWLPKASQPPSDVTFLLSTAACSLLGMELKSALNQPSCLFSPISKINHHEYIHNYR